MNRETWLELVWKVLKEQGRGEIQFAEKGAMAFTAKPFAFSVRGKRQYARAMLFRRKTFVYTDGTGDWREAKYEDVSM